MSAFWTLGGRLSTVWWRQGRGAFRSEVGGSAGAATPVALTGTLPAYDPRFETGRSRAEASGPVSLNHPFCASFRVLGGASCSR